MTYKHEAAKCAETKMDRMLGEAKRSAKHDVAVHDRTAPHLSEHKVEKIARKEAHEVEGRAVSKRLDRGKYKAGGRTKGSPEVKIVIVGGGGGAPPMPGRPMMPPGAMPPPGPPIGSAPPPGLGAMPGAPGGMPPRKRGGKIMTAGAGSGIGRLQKAAIEGAKA